MRCIEIILPNSSSEEFGDNPTFYVEHLDDRMFTCGFRVLQPEINADPRRIEYDTDNVRYLCNLLDQQEEYNPPVVHDKHIAPSLRSAKDPNRRRA